MKRIQAFVLAGACLLILGVPSVWAQEPESAATLKSSPAVNLSAPALLLPQADYVLLAKALHSLDKGGHIKLQSDYAQSSGAVAWTVPDSVPAGKYYIGMVAVTGRTNGVEYLHERPEPKPWIYLNGRPVPLRTATAATDISNIGIVAELETAEAMMVHPGDQLRPAKEVSGRWVGRLALYKEQPTVGPLDVWRYVAVWSTDRLRPTASVTLPDAFTKPAHAALDVRNVSGQSIDAHVSWKLVDYFERVIQSGKKTVPLDDRQSWSHEFTFPWGDSDRYRLIVKVDEADGPQEIAVKQVLAPAKLSDHRNKVWLDKGWQFAALPESAREVGTQPPADAQWQGAQLPGSWHHRTHAGWYRLRFAMPTWMTGKRVVLHFTHVNYEATVYLNGKRLAYHLGRFAPFDVDITDAVRPNGENTLLVAMRDGIAGMTPEARNQKRLVWRREPLIAPGAERSGSMGAVVLLTMPSARIDHVFVQPSVRHHKLTVALSTDHAPAGAIIRQQVLYKGKPVLKLPDTPVSSTDTTTAGVDWKDPILWDIGKGRLLQLKSELVSADGRVLDQLDTRFGFREIWTDGMKLMLNGRPVRLVAAGVESNWGLTRRMQRGYNRLRLRMTLMQGAQIQTHVYAWDNRLDAADELGVLIKKSTTRIVRPTQQRLESDQYWENARRMAVSAVKRNRNHPSIVFWYMSNEFGEHSSNPEVAIPRLQKLGQAVREVDPTRLLEYGCDLDLRGWGKIISTHYPIDILAMRMPDAYWPDSVLWRPAGTQFYKGQQVPAGQVQRVANVRRKSPITWGVKPISINETGWIQFFRPPYGFASVFGDWPFRGPASNLRAFNKVSAMFYAGDRDAGVSIITPWIQMQRGLSHILIPRVDVFPFTLHSRWYAGQHITWDVDVFHDVDRTAKGELRWAISADGKTLGEWRQPVALEPAGLYRLKVAFDVPSVSKTTNGVLTLSLWSDGHQLRQRQYDCRIFPRDTWSWPDSGVALYDPAGHSAEALGKLGFHPARVDELTAASLDKIHVLIIGAGADETMAGGTGKLISQFVNAGGRVLVLHQTKIDQDQLGVSLSPHASLIRSTAFVRAPNHPIMRGLTDADLRFWYPNSVVSRDDIVKPAQGDFTCLIDTGTGNEGLNYTPLLELRRGKGAYLFSQLQLLDRLGENPIADLLLHRMVQYLNTPLPQHGSAMLLAGPGGQTKATLKRLGVIFDSYNRQSLDAAGLLVVGADARPQTGDVEAIGQFLADGGQVLVHRPADDAGAWLSQLAGRSVTLHKPVLSAWAGRAIRRQPASVLDGISNGDFFWRRPLKRDNIGGMFFSSDYMLDSLMDRTCQVQGISSAIYPAGVVIVPRGKGKLVIDTLRWDIAAGDVQQKADRIASSILANLGAAFEQNTQSGQWLTALNYVPVNLSGFTNRALTDEVANDGRGGWTDQGPKADLRGFKTGYRVFHGVPFEIASPESCIVLASKTRPESNVPEAVRGIPIHHKAHALYFLQDSDRTGEHHLASYIIHYEDGSQETIRLIGGVNQRSWDSARPDAPFIQRGPTLTRVAWTRADKQGGKASVYLTQWVNPHPDKPLASFDFVSMNDLHTGVPILLGVTLGVQETSSSAKSAHGHANAALAAKLDDQAKKHIASGDLKGAVALLNQAIQADARNVVPRLRLAHVLVQLHEDAQARASLRETIQAIPGEVEPYNLLGRLYEQDRDFAAAAKVYGESIKVNLNQPEILTRLKRVEARVKK